jgi:probable O-glycosylation ligase (exosortase A-associated)
MRGIILVLGTLFYVPASIVAPAAGLLCWEWVSLMAPHQEVYGFAAGQQFGLVIAVATLFGWLCSKERKRFTPDALPWMLLIWFAWMTVTTIAAPVQEVAWHYWNEVLRILVPVLLSFVLLTNRARIQGMIWVIVISIGFYGIKGGGFALLGHGGVINGPPGTMMGDNNSVALAVVMQIPLVFYLWKHTRLAWLRFGLALAIPLEILMVIGSHSRGGVIALSVMLGAFWLRADRKIVYGLVGAAMVVGALAIMPDVIWERLGTLNNVQADGSFEGRVMAWHIAVDIAQDYFPFGVGFYSEQQAQIWDRYDTTMFPHAAHSIYFQILGEHGFIGLAIYAVVLLLPLYNATLVVWRTRKNPELAWAHDLAEMIRVALLAFYVGGAALSMAYFDGYLLLLALSSTLRELTAPKRALSFVAARAAAAASRGAVVSATGPVAAAAGMAGTNHPWSRRHAQRHRSA